MLLTKTRTEDTPAVKNETADVILKQIKKRDGRFETFDIVKIVNAVKKALMASMDDDGVSEKDAVIATAAWDVAEYSCELARDAAHADGTVDIEDIQDSVELALMEKQHFRAAKAYILYRESRHGFRERHTRLMNSYAEIVYADAKDSDEKRSNGNIDGNTAMGSMLQFGATGAKAFYLQHMVGDESAKAHEDGDIHIHDLDFYSLTSTCCQIDIEKLFKGGFSTGHGYIREPNSIASYGALLAIALQANQNEQHGGQSIPNFDRGLAEGVRKTFRTNFIKYYGDVTGVLAGREIEAKKLIEGYERESCEKVAIEMPPHLIDLMQTKLSEQNYRLVYERALRDTKKQTHQAMESLVHNLNTMHCLAEGERIWVYDKETKRMNLIAVEQLADCFEKGRYQAPSLNPDTGDCELKDITDAWCNGVRADVYKLTTEAGQEVTLTGNHRIKVWDTPKGRISDAFASHAVHVLTPRNIGFLECDSQVCHVARIKKLVKLCRKEAVLLDNLLAVNITDRTMVNPVLVYDISVADNESFLTEDGIWVHNSRAGAQVPFTSINYGTDTSPEGRLVVRAVLQATMEGLGNGETPIFPIQVFRRKKGINFEKGDPNYDLFRLSMECSAKRLYPNYSFQDATFNNMFLDPEDPRTEIGYMGCRTRVISNVYDPAKQLTYGRGNLNFTTINLPRLALMSDGIEDFMGRLDEKLMLVADQTYSRYQLLAKKKIRNFPFLMGQGVWLDSDTLGPDDEIGEILRHGTLTIGFIGLAETLTALTGSHHGENEEAQELGLKIIGHMRKFCDSIAKERKMNYSLIATPAEGLSGRFTALDKKRFGVVRGVTDKEYYTNSFHLPVNYDSDAFHKIKTEAPYHELTNAGHISYVEVDGDLSSNLPAFEKILNAMADANMGYGAVNHPIDYDPVCGYTGTIGDECPKCYRRETPDSLFERIRRITGYLTGTLARWNNAKQSEERDRVKHDIK